MHRVLSGFGMSCFFFFFFFPLSPIKIVEDWVMESKCIPKVSKNICLVWQVFPHMQANKNWIRSVLPFLSVCLVVCVCLFLFFLWIRSHFRTKNPPRSSSTKIRDSAFCAQFCFLAVILNVNICRYSYTPLTLQHQKLPNLLLRRIAQGMHLN